MKTLVLGVVVAAGFLTVGCSDPCGDLGKQKVELCKKKMGGNPLAQGPCENQLDQVVKTANKDSCKATIDSYAK